MVDYLGNVANATEQFVKQCDDGSWCCEAETPPLDNHNILNSTMQNQVNGCCSQGKGVFINKGKVTNVNPSGTATSTSATAAATKSPSSPTPSSSSQHNSHVGGIAGGVVGGVAGLVFIVVATFYCRRRKRNPDCMHEAWNLHEKQGNERFETDGTQMAAWNLHEKQGNERFETDGTQVVGERNGTYEI